MEGTSVTPLEWIGVVVLGVLASDVLVVAVLVLACRPAGDDWKDELRPCERGVRRIA